MSRQTGDPLRKALLADDPQFCRQATADMWRDLVHQRDAAETKARREFWWGLSAGISLTLMLLVAGIVLWGGRWIGQ